MFIVWLIIYRISRDIEQFLLTYEPELETRADETVDEHKTSVHQAISFEKMALSSLLVWM